jgi:response regulator of citrate/malate metabolism
MKMKCLIIDEDPDNRNVIAGFIQNVDFLELTASTDSPAEASELIKNKLIDLIFLDIDVLKLCGTEFLKYANSANIVITISGVEYAVEAFTIDVLTYLLQLDILEYLIKPISFDFFLKVCTMAVDTYSKGSSLKKTQNTDDRFYALCDHLVEKVFNNDLRHAEAMINLYTNRK